MKRDRVVSSVRWALVENGLSALTGLLSTLTIGHFIKPIELGQAGAAMAVIGLVEIAAALGIGEALVRHRSFHTSLTDTAYAGLLLLSLVGAAACLALAAPIAWLYGDREVGILIAVGSLLLPMSAIDIVPVAILMRKMRIDVLAKRGILSKISVLLVGASLAYAGFGAWSILLGTFVGSGLASLCLLAGMQRWPRLRIDWPELRELIAFGGPMSLEALIGLVATRLFGLMFGAFHGLAALGYLQFAQRLIDEIAALIQSFTLRFGLPYFARLERMGGDSATAFLLGTKMITFIGAPVLLGFAAVSPDVLSSVIGARWLPSIDYIVVAALSWSTVVPTLLVSPALRARGKQAALVATSAASCALSLFACVLSAQAGPLLVALAFGARHVMVLPAALWVVRRYFGISFRRYVGAFAAPLGWAIAMAIFVWQLHSHTPGMDPFERLLVLAATGAIVYALPILLLERTIMNSIRPLVMKSS